MPTVVEDAVYRNHRMKLWVDMTYSEEHDRQVAWETFFAIRKMFPETELALRGECIASGVNGG